MNNPLTTDHYPLTTVAQQRLACELTGAQPEDLLKVRATDDSLIVIIRTGQKFIYNLAAIQTAVERLAAGLGRFTDDYFQGGRDVDPPPPPDTLPADTVVSGAAPAKTKPRARKNKPK